jgi:hypothetical protein
MMLDTDTLRWTLDTDYVWHAVNKLDTKDTALCSPVPEWANSGLFRYPRHMLSFKEICTQCNRIASEVVQREQL